MQTIDPIKPYRPQQRDQHRTPDLGPPPNPRGQMPVARKSIDGIMPPRPREMPPRMKQPPTAPPPQPRALPPRPMPQPASHSAKPLVPNIPAPSPVVFKTSSRSSLPKKIMAGVLLALMLIGVAWATQQPLGQLLVMSYGVVALIKGIPSRTTFMLALGALVLVPVSLTIIGGQNIISSAFATYAFLLLVIGTLTLGLELRREPKTAHA